MEIHFFLTHYVVVMAVVIVCWLLIGLGATRFILGNEHYGLVLFFIAVIGPVVPLCYLFGLGLYQLWILCLKPSLIFLTRPQ